MTLNQAVELLKNIGEAHYQLKKVGYGEIHQIEEFIKNDSSFPVMWISNTNATIKNNTKEYLFTLLFFDLVNQTIDFDNTREIHSDCLQIASDVVAVLKNESEYFNVKNEILIEFFSDEISAENLAGVKVDVLIEFDHNNNYCNIPIDELVFNVFNNIGGGEFGGGTGKLNCEDLIECETISTIKADIENLEENTTGDITTINNKITTINEILILMNDIINNLNDSLITAAQINTLNQQINTINQTISNIEGEVDNVNDQISTLGARADKIDSDIQIIEENIDGLELTLSTLSTETDSSLNEFNDRLTVVEDEVVVINDQIVTLGARTNKIDEDMVELEESVTNLSTEFNDRLTVVEDDTTELFTLNTTLATDVAAIDESLTKLNEDIQLLAVLAQELNQLSTVVDGQVLQLESTTFQLSTLESTVQNSLTFENIYLNFTEIEPFIYKTPYPFKINSFSVNNSVVPTITVNNQPYTLGSIIYLYDEVKVEVSGVAFIILNTEKINLEI
jgi:predicted  nucleic acid-binding Zn-ribbon protein